MIARTLRSEAAAAFLWLVLGVGASWAQTNPDPPHYSDHPANPAMS